MATYRYTDVIISNLPVVATKIARQVGVVPTGLSDSDNVTEVSFSTDLTVEQKSTLDTLMGTANIDVVPTTTNTTYILGELENIKGVNGLDFDVYPTPSGLVIQFTKVLTNTEKNNFKNAVGGLLIIS